MQFEIDPEFQRLSRAFERAAQEYQVALAKRQRDRAQADGKRSLAGQPRRPVGAPATLQIPQPVSGPGPAATSAGRPARLYLGPILGWVELRGRSTPVPEPEAEALPDVDAMFDRISLELDWRVKNRYEEAKKALDDYVDRRKMEGHRKQARTALGQAASLQLLGVEADAERLVEEAVREVEAASENAWRLYQNSPNPKSPAAILLLLSALADAQLAGAEGPASQQLQTEADRLLTSGRLKREI